MEDITHDATETERSSEKNRGRFSIIHSEEAVCGDDMPALAENSILHYLQGVPGGEKLHRFKLLTVIDGLHYIFSLSQSFGNSYGLSFKTEEYEYATTKLTKEDRDELVKTIAGFVESITAEYAEIISVRISPADAGYSSQEIEECTDAILASPENTLTREDLSREYNGYEIFERYRDLFGANFQTRHHNKRSRAPGRSRFFKKMIRNYLSDWQIDDPYGGADFYLKRKENGKNMSDLNK